ncbi:MAG: PKD domain-containing protein [Chloroflexota bacterium]|nr:PKD domain-containing protein [Chloroflexota bacterium]
MKALLRPLFVGGLSIAIAATSLVGTSSVALGATKPTFTTLSISAPVYEGDRPFVTATFTDPDAGDQHTVDIGWGDDTYDTYTLPVGDRSFSVQKSVAYVNETADLFVQVTLSDGVFSTSRFVTLTVLNAAPSITSFGLSSSDMEAGQAVTANGAFTDGAADTHIVTFGWGDGSPNTTKNLAAGVYSFRSDAHTYTAAGDFTVTATVTDNAGASATATSSVSVHAPNQAPSITSFGVTAGSEGGSSTLALTFADVDVLDTHTVSVAWGDGSTSDPMVLAAGVTTFGASHVYADTGAYSVVLTLVDSAGHSVTASSSVSPTNVAPVVGSLSLSPSSVVDHQTLTVSGAFTDPGTADTFTVTVDWGDGTSSSDSLAAGVRSFSVTHAYNAAGPVTITATVADRDNGRSSSSATLTVLPSNHAPADLAVQATPVLEGGATTLTVSFTDAEASDTHTVAITWGDGSTENISLAAAATSTSRGHTYLETGTYTVAVTVTDGGGMSVAGGTTVIATNVSPSLSSLVFTPSSVTDHQTVTVSGTFSDPGTADTFTMTVAWGDGTSSTASLAAGVRSFSASHDYAAAGTYDVIVVVTDRDSGAGTQNAFLVVSARNTAPSGLSVSSNVTGLSATISGSFTDPDANDTHDVSLAWGDGTTTQSTLAAGVTSFSATHTYASAGTFTVTVTVTDSAGASTNATKSVVTSVLSSTPSEIVDQMSALILSFNLDRTTERWLLRKLDDLQASVAYGNDQVCSSSGTLNHLMAYAQRTLTSDQYAALNALATKLQVAASCPNAGSLFPKVQKAPTVTTKTATPTPAPKKDTTSKTTKGDPTPTGGHDSH